MCSPSGRRSVRRSLLAAAAGFLGYGLWAVFANSAHGSSAALRAGLVQGSYSFALTLTMSIVTEWIYAGLADLRLRAPLTVIVVAGALFVTAYGINAAAGTPEIIATIAPGFVIGTLYTGAYVLALQRDRVRAEVNGP